MKHHFDPHTGLPVDTVDAMRREAAETARREADEAARRGRLSFDPYTGLPVDATAGSGEVVNKNKRPLDSEARTSTLDQAIHEYAQDGWSCYSKDAFSAYLSRESPFGMGDFVLFILLFGILYFFWRMMKGKDRAKIVVDESGTVSFEML